MLLSVIFSFFILQTSIFCTENNVQKSDKFSRATLEDLKTKSKGGIIEFNSDLLKKFSRIDHQNRDYNLFIIFNALDKETNCQYCGFAAETFAKFSNIFYKKGKMGKNPSFFASIELRDNMEAFQMMGLDHVPVIMHFGPEARVPTKYENKDPSDPAYLLQFFATQSGSEINMAQVMKPEPNYSYTIIFASTVIVLAGLMFTGKLPVSTVFQNTYLWSVSIMGFIMLMLSGYMWVKIRNPPFIGATSSGEAMYFANSPQSQLGIESRLITGINVAIVTAFLLITPITYKLEDNNKRRIAAMVMSLIYMAGHAGLLKFFTQKFPGYPFSYIF